MLEVIKEALPTMAGRAWRMTPWEWEVEEEEEAMAWGVSLEAGVALEEVREAQRAPEANPAQTETAASKKGEIAENLSILLQQYNQMCPRPMWTQGSCPTLDGDRRPYGRTPPGMSILLLTIGKKVPVETRESRAAEAPDGAQQHRQLPPRPLEVGGVDQAAQALVQEVLAGENGQPLGVTAKAQRVEQVGRVAGTMDLATRGAPTTVTPGAITLTKMTGPIPGLMHPNRSRAGVPVVETEVNPGVTVEMEPDQGAATTGGSPKKVPTHRAGTTTAAGQALDVGTRQAEPTPAAAATPG